MAFSRGRTIVFGSLGASIDYPLRRPFVLLVPAYDEEEKQQVEAVAEGLVELGCVEFCFVGPRAEEFHDFIDQIVESKGAFEVVTTWHTDVSDACDYFLFAAGGRSATLLALVCRHRDLLEPLEEEVRRSRQ
jgi:hypothetical protein